jgi:pimeloyl-ACP methyl ester carboxylesterase
MWKRATVVCAVVLGAMACWLVFKSYTDPIFAPHAVARLHAVAVNGDRQWLLERGCDRNKPILLFLHGGPGMPAMYLAHAFARPLERDFVVVLWDERGAGKSYRAGMDPARMTFSQMEADALEVVRYLRHRYGDKRMFLVGHSWGTFLGAHLAASHPELFYAYVGIGQDGDPAAEHATQDQLIRSKLGNQQVVTSANREDLLFQAGGELAQSKSMLPLILTGLMAPEYSLKDALNVAKGPKFARAHLRYDVPGGYGVPPQRFAIPVYVVMGANDMVTPKSLARTWFDHVQAPRKEWFEVAGAAHFPHLERPAVFADIMRQVLRQTLTENEMSSSGALPIPRFGLQCVSH